MSKRKSWWQSALSQRFAATLSIAVFGFVAMLATGDFVNPNNLKTQTLDAGAVPPYGYSFSPHGVNLGTIESGDSFTQNLTFERYSKTDLGNDNVRFSLNDNSNSPQWCSISPSGATVNETSSHSLTVTCNPGNDQAGYHNLLVISTSESNESRGLWATNSTSIEFTVNSSLLEQGELCSNNSECSTGNCSNGSCAVPPVCGNGSCESTETASSCANDCGTTPTTTPTITPTSTTTVSSCMWRDDNNSCIADGVWAYTTQYDGGQPRWCRALGSGWTCQATNPNGATTTTTSTTPTSTTTTTTTSTPTTTPTSTTTVSSCMWRDDNNSCIADGVWAYTTQYDGGQPRWCRALGSGWTCQATNPNGSTTTTTTPTPTSTSTPTPTTYADSSCVEYKENGLTCNKCKDSSGKVTNDSCWSSTIGTAPTSSNSCDYYKGENSLVCMKCKDSNGTLTNKSCWQETSYTNMGQTGATSQELADQTAHCEYKEQKPAGQNYSQWCEVCTSKNGNVLRDTCNNSTPNPVNPVIIDPPTDPVTPTDSEWCEWKDNGNGGGCNTCYDSSGNIKEETCNEGNEQENFADPQEVERQIKDMRENLRWREHDLKEFSRFEKRITRKTKEFEKKVESIKKDLEWMTRDGMDASGLESIITKVNTAIEDLKKIQPSVETERKAFETELKREQTTLDQLQKNKELTWDHLDAMQMIMRKGDLYQMKRDIYDGRLSFYEMLDNYYEWLKEKEKVVSQVNRDNVKLTDEQKDNLKEGEKWFNELEDLHGEFLTAVNEAVQLIIKAPNFTEVEELLDWEVRDDAREFYDFDMQDAWNDLRWARDGLNSHGWDNQILWESLEEVRRSLETKNNLKWITDEIQIIRGDIDVFERVIKALKGKLDPSNEKKLMDLSGVLPKAREILDEMERFVQNSDNPESMHEELQSFWDNLERLENYVDTRVNDISNYVQNHWAQIQLSDSDRQAVEIMLRDQSDGGHQGGQECYKCDRLYDVYTEDIANQLKEKIKSEINIDAIIMQVKSDVMEQIMKYVEEEVSGRVYEVILNNLDKLKGEKFGDNLGNEMLENGSKVTEKLNDVEFDASDSRDRFENEFKQLEALKNDFEHLPMPNLDVANRSAAYWEDVQAALDRTPTKDELESLIEEGEKLFDEAEETKYVYHLGFKDVPYVFDDEASPWYSDDVVIGALDGRWEGYKNEEGLTYYFGPSDPTLRAEAIKMVLAAFGYGESGGGQNWWDGWANRARELGASLAEKDMTQQVTRGEVMRLIYEVGHFAEPSEFHGYLPDVKASDDWKAAETMYEAGIIRGDGITGNARLYDTLNRAESAAVINRAAQWKGDNEFMSEDFSRRVFQRETRAPKEKSLTLRMFLKTMLPPF